MFVFSISEKCYLSEHDSETKNAPKKFRKLVAMFYVLVRTFVLFFMELRKQSVLLIFETFLQKSFVKDQKNFRGTCCFSISENLVTIHLTYAENGFVKLAVFFGTPLN